MLKTLPLKLSSWLLIVAVLTVAFNGFCQTAHAMQDCVSKTVSASQVEVSAAGDCPCCPVEHDGFDACGDCVNCICHTSITIQQFTLSYVTVTSDIGLSERFTHLPEVYLSKFIPPQNLV